MPFVQSEYQIDVWIDMPVEEAERSFAPWRVAVEAEGDGTRLRCGRDRLELFADATEHGAADRGAWAGGDAGCFGGWRGWRRRLRRGEGYSEFSRIRPKNSGTY